MKRRVAVVALAFAVVRCGAERQLTPSSPPAAETARPPAPPASPSTGVAPDAKPDALDPSGAARCLSEDERERDLAISFKLRSKLAVVRVAPNDVLWVRRGPGASEEIVGKLSFDARDVTPTGRVCRVSDTPWFEVSSGTTRGFANGQFLVPATEPVDETARFAKVVTASGFASVEALAEAVGQALEREQTEPSEVRFATTLVGVARSGGRGVAVLYACCYADDSVMGEQIRLDAVEQNGRWTLERARVSRLCPRGTSASACL